MKKKKEKEKKINPIEERRLFTMNNNSNYRNYQIMKLIKTNDSNASDSQLKNICKTIFDIKPHYQEKINIFFKNYFRKINNIITSEDITVEKLLSKYLSNYGENQDKSIHFFYKCSKLEKNDKKKLINWVSGIVQ